MGKRLIGSQSFFFLNQEIQVQKGKRKMDRALKEKLRDLAGWLSLRMQKRVYHRYQLDDRVMYFDVERGVEDEGRIVSTTGWGQYTIENPDGDRMIFDEKDLKPYSGS
jgi:hypothetical protein